MVVKQEIYKSNLFVADIKNDLVLYMLHASLVMLNFCACLGSRNISHIVLCALSMISGVSYTWSYMYPARSAPIKVNVRNL